MNQPTKVTFNTSGSTINAGRSTGNLSYPLGNTFGTTGHTSTSYLPGAVVGSNQNQVTNYAAMGLAQGSNVGKVNFVNQGSTSYPANNTAYTETRYVEPLRYETRIEDRPVYTREMVSVPNQTYINRQTIPVRHETIISQPEYAHRTTVIQQPRVTAVQQRVVTVEQPRVTTVEHVKVAPVQQVEIFEERRPVYQKLYSNTNQLRRKEAGDIEVPEKKNKCCSPCCWVLWALLGLAALTLGLLFGLGVIGGFNGPHLDAAGAAGASIGGAGAAIAGGKWSDKDYTVVEQTTVLDTSAKSSQGSGTNGTVPIVVPVVPGKETQGNGSKTDGNGKNTSNTDFQHPPEGSNTNGTSNGSKTDGSGKNTSNTDFQHPPNEGSKTNGTQSGSNTNGTSITSTIPVNKWIGDTSFQLPPQKEQSSANSLVNGTTTVVKEQPAPKSAFMLPPEQAIVTVIEETITLPQKNETEKAVVNGTVSSNVTESSNGTSTIATETIQPVKTPVSVEPISVKPIATTGTVVVEKEKVEENKTASTVDKAKVNGATSVNVEEKKTEIEPIISVKETEPEKVKAVTGSTTTITETGKPTISSTNGTAVTTSTEVKPTTTTAETGKPAISSTNGTVVTTTTTTQVKPTTTTTELKPKTTITEEKPSNGEVLTFQDVNPGNTTSNGTVKTSESKPLTTNEVKPTATTTEVSPTTATTEVKPDSTTVTEVKPKTIAPTVTEEGIELTFDHTQPKLHRLHRA